MVKYKSTLFSNGIDIIIIFIHNLYLLDVKVRASYLLSFDKMHMGAFLSEECLASGTSII